MIDILMPMIKQFLPFAQERMGFANPPRLFLRSDAKNAVNPLGRTAHYDPAEQAVTLYVSDRHPKDIMRSLSHELVHHAQNCNGKFKNVGEMGEGYAQNDEHLREMEREAYEIGNMCFRDWEDGIKGTIYFEHLQKGDNRSMSTKDWKNNELSGLLAEAWGFKFNTLQEFDEFNGTGDIQEVSIEDPDAPEDETKGDASDEWEEEGLQTEEKSAEGEADDEDLDDPLSEGSKWGHGKDEYKRSKDKEGHEAKTGEGPDGHYKDYEGPSGGNKDDKSKTDKGDKDYTWRKGGKSKSHPGKLNKEGRVTEDSGEEEGEHYDRNREEDDDHIAAIRHHLDALERDRDYDDDHIDEGGAAARKGPEFEKRDIGRNRMRPDRIREEEPPGKRDMQQHKSDLSEARLRQIIRQALKEKKRHG